VWNGYFPAGAADERHEPRFRPVAPRRAAGSDEIARMGNAFDHLADAFADTLRQIKSEAHQMMAAANS
jgi:hypothetical protein